MLGVGGDEGLGGHIADTDSSGFFGHGCYCFGGVVEWLTRCAGGVLAWRVRWRWKMGVTCYLTFNWELVIGTTILTSFLLQTRDAFCRIFAFDIFSDR